MQRLQQETSRLRDDLDALARSQNDETRLQVNALLSKLVSSIEQSPKNDEEKREGERAFSEAMRSVQALAAAQSENSENVVRAVIHFAEKCSEQNNAEKTAAEKFTSMLIEWMTKVNNRQQEIEDARQKNHQEFVTRLMLTVQESAAKHSEQLAITWNANQQLQLQSFTQQNHSQESQLAQSQNAQRAFIEHVIAVFTTRLNEIAEGERRAREQHLALIRQGQESHARLLIEANRENNILLLQASQAQLAQQQQQQLLAPPSVTNIYTQLNNDLNVTNSVTNNTQQIALLGAPAGNGAQPFAPRLGNISNHGTLATSSSSSSGARQLAPRRLFLNRPPPVAAAGGAEASTTEQPMDRANTKRVRTEEIPTDPATQQSQHQQQE
jgi:hypothetical protein